ncbi:class I SAM-dependent methyltransferase [Streptomyces roseifaciens]|uniref:class I SAM-dependent methyltransferase n=1 Tax=Streptomyces roseifaciens TaxID=1488406 RepID=UPI0007180542|nr:class I SAM-dependent methyltransferase [Streptomyces roseifaciens]
MTQERTAEQYDVIGARWEDARSLPTVHPERASFLALLGDVTGLDVLDLACGDGFYTRQAKMLGAQRVVGADVSEEMVAAARAVEERAPLGTRYVAADAADLPDLGSFDVVTAAYLLNYAREEATLTAMCRGAFERLPQGGRFIGVTQNPHFSFEGPLPDPYGFAFAPLETSAFGTRIRVTAALEPPITFETCLIRPEVYEAAFAAAGFTKVSWVPLHVPQAVLERFGAAYWEGFLANPPIVMFEAVR